MPYAITYPSASPLKTELTTDSASDAVKLARALISKGHQPTITKDGREFSIDELSGIDDGGNS